MNSDTLALAMPPLTLHFLKSLKCKLTLHMLLSATSSKLQRHLIVP